MREIHFFVLADLEAYIDAHEQAASLFTNSEEWIKKSIYNSSSMGFFSSDRAVQNYAANIWSVPCTSCSGES